MTPEELIESIAKIASEEKPAAAKLEALSTIMRLWDGLQQREQISPQLFLLHAGWRQGRDRLWRNDEYGGSWNTENALKQEAERPVARQRVMRLGE